jgi:hypothetical protein
MRPFSRRPRGLTAARATLVAGLSLGVIAGLGFTQAAVGSPATTAVTATTTAMTTASSTSASPAATTSRPIVASVVARTPATTAPVVARPARRVFATGNARLDALLPTLPSVLFSAGAHVHFGYNPIDCCHAGGYNPGPNDVWVSERALVSTARLTYVTVHELAHSVHLRTAFEALLTAAVAGAPAVRPGSPWDVSEKVADCVAWALYPAQTAASGITYWTCPDPWRSQVRAALAP